MIKTDLVYISDILQALDLISEYLDSKTLVDLANDIQLQDSVVRRLEVVGVAAGKVSQAVKQLHQEIQWREIVDTRNRIAHNYDDIDIEVVWDIYEMDLPTLKSKLLTVLQELKSKESTV